MKLLDILKSKLRREGYQPTFLSLFFNPVYLVHNGLNKHIKEFALQVEGKILDFGCGSKPYENLFVKATEYIGCDIEVSGHDHSQSNIDYFYDGQTLPFEDKTFDAVVSFEVLEHVFNLSEVLNEIHRVTKDSGTLLISIPFAWGEHEIPYDFARYTSYGIIDILKKHGFEVIVYKKTPSQFLAIAQLFISYIVQNIAPRGLLFYYIFHFLLIFPLTCFCCCLNLILPQNYDLFSCSVILARKV